MENEEIIIHTDGGARGNPGPAACAFVAEFSGKTIGKKSLFLGVSTNNCAEYQGVLLALKWLAENRKNFSAPVVTFYLDSELVARQLAGKYKVKDKKLMELSFRAISLSKEISLEINYKNIPREENKIADFLVNEELDKQSLAKLEFGKNSE
jgi:ribonuclease HI